MALAAALAILGGIIGFAVATDDDGTTAAYYYCLSIVPLAPTSKATRACPCSADLILESRPKALASIVAAVLLVTAYADGNDAIAYPGYSYEDTFLQAQEPRQGPHELPPQEAPMALPVDPPEGAPNEQSDRKEKEPTSLQRPPPASGVSCPSFELGPPNLVF